MGKSEDLARLLNDWGKTDSQYDLNRDGVVDAVDIAILMASDNGFYGPTEEPDPIGVPNDLGYDAKAICRWTTVPFIEIKEKTNIGLVAFHMNGIDRVEFSVNGSTWTAVTQPSLNTQNNVKEYFIEVDPTLYPDGQIEIRAIAYPKIGIPRVLQGSIENTVEEPYKVPNGNHSMFVTCNAKSSLKNDVLFASPDGSDITGDGTEVNPYQTIQGALSKLSAAKGDCDGATLYLKAGDYAYAGPKFPSKIVTKNRYVTVTTAPGVARDDVRIVSSELGGLGTRLICMRNILFVGEVAMRTPTSLKSYAWIDGCKAYAGNPEIGGGFVAGAWTTACMTNCEADMVRNCYRGASFILNCKGTRFSDTPIGQDSLVVNTTFDEFIRNSNGDHADVFHWFYTKPGNRENRIIYGLNVSRFSLQGWQVNPIRNGGQRLDNVALIDVRISKDISNAAGSWWYMDTNHLYMNNVSLPDQTLRWKVHGQDEDGKMSLSNVMIRDSHFRSMIWLPPEVMLENTRIGI